MKKEEPPKPLSIAIHCQFFYTRFLAMSFSQILALSRSEEIAAKLLSTLLKDSNKKKIVGIVV